MTTSRIAVVGQVARDLVLRVDAAPDAGAAVDVRSRHEVLGGKGANQAVAVAQLGGQPALVGVVGEDDVGDDLLAQARRDGIDVARVARRGVSAVIVEVLDAAGQWRYLQDLPELLTEADVAAAADLLRTSSAVLVQLQQPPEATVAAARHGRAGGALVVCDGAPADDDRRDALLAATDVLRADAHETELLLGTPADDVDRTLEAAQDLLARGLSLLAFAVDDGNLFVWPDGHLMVPTTDAPVADTTGAGDALTAALAVALVRGEGPRGAARSAAAAATVTVGHPGGRPRLDQGALPGAVEKVDNVLPGGG